MIAYTPADNFGNFLVEAASYDVPVFLLEGDFGPEWFTGTPELGVQVRTLYCTSSENGSIY
jgi:hypothetical protein